ncbi:MAG: YicC/YloC family endoribonuclease, partial [Spirochaetota bacterium]
MKSMTGFGYSEYQDRKVHITVELKAYNNRYLDLLVNLPPYLSPLEPRVREFLKNRISRGRVELYLKMRELEEDLSIILDKKVVEGYAVV